MGVTALRKKEHKKNHRGRWDIRLFLIMVVLVKNVLKWVGGVGGLATFHTIAWELADSSWENTTYEREQ
jgi:hypothetical protein